MKKVKMLNKKATKIKLGEFSGYEIRWQMIDDGKNRNSIQKTDAVEDFHVSHMPHQSLLTAISEDASLMDQFFANDSLGG